MERLGLHTGPGHADVDLTLAQKLPTGDYVFQTWTVCECSMRGLRTALGPPQLESVQTVESLRATGEAVMKTPGAFHFGEGL